MNAVSVNSSLDGDNLRTVTIYCNNNSIQMMMSSKTVILNYPTVTVGNTCRKRKAIGKTVTLLLRTAMGAMISRNTQCNTRDKTEFIQ